MVVYFIRGMSGSPGVYLLSGIIGQEDGGIVLREEQPLLDHFGLYPDG